MHTAAWEVGISYSMLEAMAMGIPVFARRIEPLTMSPMVPWLFDEPEMIDALVAAHNDRTILQSVVDSQRGIVLSMSIENQNRSLSKAYRLDRTT